MLEDRLEEETEVLVVQVEFLSPVGTVIIGQGTVRVIVVGSDKTGSVCVSKLISSVLAH